jgi:protein arginine N-methyltransferase 1
MIADKVRTNAYVEALRRAVKPGSIVLDIGTGTGFFAMLACKFGARKVYAVEPADAIQVAREIAAANGYADRIEFFQNLSTRITLSERVDVVISDLRGVLPLFQHHIPSIIDARERLLKPGGCLIPLSDTLWVAIAKTSKLYHDHVKPWNNSHYGLDMKAALKIVTNSWSKRRVKLERLLGKPKCWATLDYAKIKSPNVSGKVTWTVGRAGMAYGLSVWFDAMLAKGIPLTNAPSSPELIYGSIFIPWSKPVALTVGDTVIVKLHADLVVKDYVWRWDTQILDQGHPTRIKADFRQSTFFGVPLSPEQLRKKASSYVPKLNEDGKVDQFVLGLLNSDISLREIANSVLDQFPDRFAKWENALTHVAELSQKYSQ